MLAFAADALTFSRLIAAGVLVWLGLQGPATLRAAIAVGAVGWATDMLDGWVARRAGGGTRLAPYDFLIDSVLYAGILAYLTLMGFVPPLLAGLFVAVVLTMWLVYRRKAVQILCVRLVDLAAAIVIFRYEPVAGALLVLWLVLMALVYRRRLAVRIPRWFAELARLLDLSR